MDEKWRSSREEIEEVGGVLWGFVGVGGWRLGVGRKIKEDLVRVVMLEVSSE